MKRINLGTAAWLAGASIALSANSDLALAQGDVREQIVVTARQREEKLGDVPASITAFTESAMERASIERAEDFIVSDPRGVVGRCGGSR